MSSFTVKLPEKLTVSVEVEAEDADDAKEQAWDLYQEGEMRWSNEKVDGDTVKIEVLGVKL